MHVTTGFVFLRLLPQLSYLTVRIGIYHNLNYCSGLDNNL